MYQANLRGGKAFAAEQKLGEFRKMLLRSKRIEKIKKKTKTKRFNQKRCQKYEQHSIPKI